MASDFQGQIRWKAVSAMELLPVLAQISVYMLAPAPVPGVKTDKSSGPAEPALPNTVAGLCSEPLFCHI